MGPAASIPNRNKYQPAQAKKISLAQNKPLMLITHSNVMSGQRNATQAALQQHKKVHRGTNKKYVCSLCGKALSSTTALHKHEKIHQSN